MIYHGYNIFSFQITHDKKTKQSIANVLTLVSVKETLSGKLIQKYLSRLSNVNEIILFSSIQRPTVEICTMHLHKKVITESGWAVLHYKCIIKHSYVHKVFIKNLSDLGVNQSIMQAYIESSTVVAYSAKKLDDNKMDNKFLFSPKLAHNF